MSPSAKARCPVCGQDALRSSDRTWLDRRLAVCAACGVVALATPPTAAELEALYATGMYAPGAPRAASLVTRLHRAIGTVRMRLLPSRPGRVLDVGSGKGQFLDAAIRSGWSAWGIEISEAAAAEAQRRYGLSTIVGDWATAEAMGPFDAITFWHVLEHLPDPVEALRRARPLLTPDGVVVVSVPNLASWQSRWFGDAWLHLDIPRHLVHFTPRSLAMVLTRAGFEIIHRDTIAPEMEVLGVVQSIQNGLGFEPNLALRFLKRDRSATGMRRGLSALAVALVSLPIAVAFAVVAGPTGHGASIQMVARPARISDPGGTPDGGTDARIRP